MANAQRTFPSEGRWDPANPVRGYGGHLAEDERRWLREQAEWLNGETFRKPEPYAWRD
jgi:hypothetical protein